MFLFFLFFFFKQETAYEMRFSDWSSDVCSSDLTRLHPDDRIDPGKTGPQVMRHVTVNAAESPIGWLASRGMLTPAQLGAGERLRGDYERAGLSARVTMRWDAAPPGKRDRKSTRLNSSH